MRAVQIVDYSGPESALRTVELPDPEPVHAMVGADGGRAGSGPGVLIDVYAAGVSFPELLQTRGEYQLKPPLPFVPGSEVAGTVVSAPDASGFAPGDRVAAFCWLGGFAEVAVAPPGMTFKLNGVLDYAQGAGLILNYHTAYFSLVTRGRLVDGETVLVHGAAGGVGTAALQIAKGLGATTVAVVSSDEKEQVARHAGADHVVRSTGPWKDEVQELTGGVDLIIDPVGGDRFTDSLRSLRRGGRVVVVGFTGGSIPEVKVNRLLLNNTEVIGAGWGGYLMEDPAITAKIAAEIERLIEHGAVRPVIGPRFSLDEVSQALLTLDRRTATGKVVLDVR